MAEVEEITEEIKNTDSQKSVTTSNVYSTDFTDNSSDKNFSSGKETYVIDWDDSDDSEESCQAHDIAAVNLVDKVTKDVVDYSEMKFVQKETDQICEVASTMSHKCTFVNVAQETFTQTSKTIIELAKSEGVVVKSADLNTLQTQTSYISITENKTVEYKIFTSDTARSNDSNVYAIHNNNVTPPILSYSLEDRSSKFRESDSDTDKLDSVRNKTTKEETMKINLDEKHIEIQRLGGDNSETSLGSSSDIEDDSLMEPQCNYKKDEKDFYSTHSDMSCTPKSVDNEVEDLYNKVSNCLDVLRVQQNIEPQLDCQWLGGTLTPLTEESTIKKENCADINSCLEKATESNKEDSENVVFTQDTGFRLKLLPENNENEKSNDVLKLPPIQSTELNSARLSFLLSGKSKDVPLNERSIDRWELKAKDLAAGESQFIHGKNQPRIPNEVFQLPPIHVDGVMQNIYTNYSGCNSSSNTSKINLSLAEMQYDAINIHDKIRELKMTQQKNLAKKESRSISPTIISSPDGSKLCDAAQKGCDALCTELLRKLKSSSWCEVVDTLEEMPKVMDKFWNVITELRIADLLRQVSIHVDSPRSQVARTACLTLACILKNTNYTRKPDFYEAVTALLVKTGSFSRPVRRAANMALDEIVCGVDFTHAVTALCVHGVGHKSPLVRCASARLLVVCCALSGGGRGLLRARPASAAAARRTALRALADLLEDKASDARKYAERLYVMLRPLANFEAYFLSDVNVELATRQMKKYDQLLILGSKDR